MRISSAAVAVALLGAASQADARFILGNTGLLTVSRMDPIISPEGLAGHVHRVWGGSAFRNVLNTPEDQQSKSLCSTTKVMADKSNYWTPTLYFINPNGTYSMLDGELRLYYNFDNTQAPLSAFPPGLRMISGLAMRRDPGANQARGVQLTMDPYKNVKTNDQFLPNGTVHPNPPDRYIQLNVYFPSCGWANQSIDSPDHFSHMAWPVNDKGEWDYFAQKCPDTHPIRYPQIFMETFHHLEQRHKDEWNKTGPSVILANGDTTGVTFHGDFVNGWDPEVLQGALDGCQKVDDKLEKCKAFEGHLQEPFNKTLGAPGNLWECRMQSQIPAEDVGFHKPLDYLPGCNPRWDWDGPTDHRSLTEGRKACPWFEGEPGWVSPNLQYYWRQEYTFPVALPGEDTSDPSKIVSSISKNGKFVTWPTGQDGKTPQSADGGCRDGFCGVLIGTQEDVDAAAKKKDSKVQPKVFGWDDPPGHFDEDKPTSTISVNMGKMTSAAATTHYTATYYCPTNTAWPGLPCGPEYVKDRPSSKSTTSASLRVLPTCACVVPALLSVAWLLV